MGYERVSCNPGGIAIKNYTSKVPINETIEDIERLLIKAGARSISKEYNGEGEVTALNFMIMCPETKAPLGVRLPANWEQVKSVLVANTSSKRRRYSAASSRTTEQAKRTAWRLWYDWVAVQLSLIEMKQAEVLQVFLPYIWAGRETFYESLRADKFKALGYSGSKDGDKDA